MHRSVLSLSILALSASVACAQSDTKPAAAAATTKDSDPDIVNATGGVTAPGWTGRIDPQSEKKGRKISEVKFVAMAPGYHVTAGPAAVYWNTANSPTGNYSVETNITQMKPASHPEGYGIVIAGKNLDKSDQSYFYFLIRQDGKFMINHRANDSTVHKLMPWTDNAAITKVPEGGKAKNILKIDLGTSDVIFSVNGTEVHRFARSQMGGVPNTSGIAGLRVNHNLDVHVESFAVTPAK